MTAAGDRPRAFASPAAFRAWLAEHHADTDALVVRLWKVHARHRGLTYKDAVDEALCAGWIDGVRKSLDADSFSVRFTPRRKRSIWSQVNLRRIAELEREGRLLPAGKAALATRDPKREKLYSFEQRPKEPDRAVERAIAAVPAAAADWAKRPPWYRRTSTHWVTSAKRDETRARRLQTLVDACARGEPIEVLRPRPGVAKPKRPAAARRSR